MAGSVPPVRIIPLPLVTSGRRSVAASVLARAADLPSPTAQALIEALDCSVAAFLRSASLTDAQALDVLVSLYCPVDKLRKLATR